MEERAFERTFGEKPIQDATVRSLACGMLRTIADYFEDPENMKKFEEWKAKREAEKK